MNKLQLSNPLSPKRTCLHGCEGPQVGGVIRPVVVGNSPRLRTILQPRDAEVNFLKVVIAIVTEVFRTSLRRSVVKRRRKNVI